MPSNIARHVKNSFSIYTELLLKGIRLLIKNHNGIIWVNYFKIDQAEFYLKPGRFTNH
jgi:hypothetical protein